MAYLVPRARGRFDIRESVHTAAGPRSRTLATSSGALTPELLMNAAARATRPFDRGALLQRASELGIPVTERSMDRAARELLAHLHSGGRVDPTLAGLVREALEPWAARAPHSLSEVREWIGVDDARRGEALRGLLRVSDRITSSRPARTSRARRPFPRIRSRRAEGKR